VLTWAVIASAEHGWGQVRPLAGLVVGLVLCVAFFAVELRRDFAGHDVLLPSTLLRSRQVIAGLSAGGVYNFVLYGMLIVTSFSFQTYRHWSPLEAGFALTPLAIAATLTSSLVSSRSMRRYGPTANLTGGMLLGVAGLAVLAVTLRSAPYPILVIGFVIFAFGQNLVAPAQTLLVVSGAPPEHANAASSALNAARQTGGVIGVALLGSIQAAYPRTGTTIALLVAATACVGAAAAAQLLASRPSATPIKL
jgi:MFS transporter, DHA2 family, methylenomycin A resistance protein